MNRTSSLRNWIATAAILSGPSVAKAITFSNVDIQAPPLSNGSFFSTTVSSITVVTPSASVGDFQVLRSGVLSVAYDASNLGGPNMNSVRVSINLGNACSGSGGIAFLEEIYELDANGNQLGLIGSLAHSFDPTSGFVWSETIQLSSSVQRFHARKTFTLDAAADTQDLDTASLALVEQTVGVVPEPAVSASLAVGALATMVRRRRAKKS